MPNDMVADMFGVDKSVVSKLFAVLLGLLKPPPPDKRIGLRFTFVRAKFHLDEMNSHSLM